MNENSTLDAETVIQFILSNNSRIERPKLEGLSLEALVLIKVQIEIELINGRNRLN